MDPHLAGALIGAASALAGAAVVGWFGLVAERGARVERRRELRRGLYEDYLSTLYDLDRIVQRGVGEMDRGKAMDEIAARALPLRAGLALRGGSGVRAAVIRFFDCWDDYVQAFQAQVTPLFQLPLEQRSEPFAALRKKLYKELVSDALTAVEEAMRAEVGAK